MRSSHAGYASWAKMRRGRRKSRFLSGQTVHNPIRVPSDGDQCDAAFTLRQRLEMIDDDVARDAHAAAMDLATSKFVVEGP